jgi:hypothetical protein
MLFALVAFIALFLLKPYFSYDNNKRIAAAILLDSQGQLDERLVSAALNARFIPNTPSREFVNFMRAHEGRCSNVENNEMSCSVPESGSFFVATNMLFVVKLHRDGTINSIDVQHYFTGP